MIIFLILLKPQGMCMGDYDPGIIWTRSRLSDLLSELHRWSLADFFSNGWYKEV